MGNYKKDEPYCQDSKRFYDCFALEPNFKKTCTCLNDTHFNRPCPFYKSKAQYEADKRAYAR